MDGEIKNSDCCELYGAYACRQLLSYNACAGLGSRLGRRRGRGGEQVLLKAVEALQGERYLALAERRPANEAFLYGWLANRLG